MSTYIVLPSIAIGGVEKRLAGLFLHMASRAEDVRLVASRELVAELEKTPDCSAVADHDRAIDVFEGGRDPFASLRATMAKIQRDARDAVFHYGLVSPLRVHRSRSKRTLYTIPNASLTQYNARGLVEVYGGILRASRVDVLDPNVFAQLASRFPWRRGSFSLTPGSFVDLDVFRAAPASEKTDRIVFCGLFTDEKQAPRLVSCLPELLARLDEAGLGHAEIWMLGRDVDGVSAGLTARVNALGPRVRAYYETNPKDVHARSKVFLSLQRSTNHPSKALLEAMACGCAPVVTDTRDSRRSAPDHLATYVPRDFAASDLANACIPLLRRSPRVIDEQVAKTREFLAERFSLDAMSAYYRMLYEQLRALPEE